MRHPFALSLLLVTGLLLPQLPAFCQAMTDDFSLPAGVENTVIPKRLHQFAPRATTTGPSPLDVKQIESFRTAIENCFHQKDYAAAEPIYTQYVALLEKVAPNNEALATALQNYSELLRKLHKEDRAIDAEKQAHAILTHLEGHGMAYGLKEYRLGMSLDDFTKLAPPGLEPTKLKVVCSCDAGQTVEVVNDADKAANIIQCGLWQKGPGATDMVTDPQPITVAGIKCNPDFKFIQDDGVYKLFEISIPFYSSNFADMKSALVAKYGEPASQKVEKMRTEMGNIFPLTNLIWDNGVSKIRLSNADGNNLGRAKLRYLHRVLFLAFSKRINESRHAPVQQASDDL